MAATNLRTGGSDTESFGTAPTLLNVTVSGSITGTFDTGGTHNLEIQPATTLNGYTGLAVTRMDASNDNESTYQTIEVRFTEPVYNVSVTVGDIDGGPNWQLSGTAFNDIIEYRALNTAGANVLPTSGSVVDATKVIWNAATGRASANGFNVTDNTGDATAVFAGPIKSFTVRHYAAANSNVTNPNQQMAFLKDFTFTRSPRLTVSKQALTGTGAFPLSVNNVLSVSGTTMSTVSAAETLTVSTAGSTTAGTQRILYATNTATVITETIPSGWSLNGATMTCTDSNTAVSGNISPFTAAVSGSTITVAAANVRAGAILTCTVVNNTALLTLQKAVTGNGTPSSIPLFTLAAAGTTSISGVTGATAVTAAPVRAGTYTLSETGPATGFQAVGWACTAGTLAGSSLTLTLGTTSVCTITNIKLPTLRISKISNGATGAFGFSGTNGVVSQTITTSSVGGTFNGSTDVLTNAGVATSFTETMPTSAWEIQTHACTGMGSGGTALLSGNTITLNTAATVAGSVIQCTVTNRRRPIVSVQKTTTGGFGGPFTFAATNLASSISNISTTAAATATPASPTKHIVSATGTAVGLTESFSATAWASSGVTCTDSNSAATGNVNPVATSLTAAVTIPGTATVVGADINCVFTNAVANPALSVTKSWAFATPGGDVNGNGRADVGDQIVYTYLVNNTGNVNLTNVVVNDIHEGTALPTTPTRVVTNETLISSGPVGTNSDATINGSYDLLTPGSQIRFRYTHTVNLTEFNAG